MVWAKLISDVFSGLVERFWQIRTEVLEKEPVLVAIRPPKLSNILTKFQDRVSRVRGWQQTNWETVRNF